MYDYKDYDVYNLKKLNTFSMLPIFLGCRAKFFQTQILASLLGNDHNANVSCVDS